MVVGVSASLRLCYDNIVLLLQGKIKAREVIDKAHSEADTEEKDFFSVYYYDDYKLAKDDEPLPQKVGVSC